MPRRARFIIPNVPYHETQRGNHRERVFHQKGDAETYLLLLKLYARLHGVRIFAYCLMPNHIHLVLVPRDFDGLHRALRAVHSQYAQRINRMRGLSGHLWQGRYYSSALDTNYFLNAVRYVELNPVSAGLCARAEQYQWSSAAAHCGLRRDFLIRPAADSPVLSGIVDWSGWLAEGVPEESVEVLRRHGRRNLPCGSKDFVQEVERLSGRPMTLRARGRQKKPAEGPR
jgi:putative transposase